MLKNFFLNLRYPKGIAGRLMLSSMNIGHKSISQWGLARLNISHGNSVLDIGCGGGKNIARMLRLAHCGNVCGLDYSETSVRMSREVNSKAVASGRADIRHGSVSAIPWPDDFFDIVTAFETVYFRPDMTGDMKEVLRVLKPGGTLCVCNETYRPENEEAPYQYFVKTLNMIIYSEKELTRYLKQAGFVDLKISLGNKKPAKLCILAKKTD
jgi:ubiquinone/menaquinone biosynthesis C-methylase UbiE